MNQHKNIDFFLNEFIGLNSFGLTKFLKSLDSEISSPDVSGIFLNPKQWLGWHEQEQRSKTKLGPLAGVPIALKDNIVSKGLTTTAGSKILEGYVPNYNAHIVDCLIAAGATIVPKTNLDEFGMGSSGRLSAYYPCQNPQFPEFVPGGSSSGSAAAVAAGFVPIAIGSDTGGSVRLPATFCHVIGFKPSYGRISRFGLIAYASSLDQIGLLGHSIEDIAKVFDLISGSDCRDESTLRFKNKTKSHDVLKSGRSDCKPQHLTFLVDENILHSNEFDPQIKALYLKNIDLVKSKGGTIIETELIEQKAILGCYYVTALVEASSNLARYDGIRFGPRNVGSSLNDLKSFISDTRTRLFGSEVKKRIILGSYFSGREHFDRYYRNAAGYRVKLQAKAKSAFAKADAILLPTSPLPMPSVGSAPASSDGIHILDTINVFSNLVGCPAISIPAGVDSSGLPFGLQVIGAVGDDERLLAIASHLIQ